MNQSASLMSFWANRSRFFCAFFLLSVFSSFISFGEFQKIHDFDKDWMIYQSNWKTFLPYIPNKHYEYHSKSILLNNDNYINNYLKISPEEAYYLFINGTYQLQFKKDSTYLFSIDSLSKKYVHSDPIIFTFYKEDLRGVPKEIHLVRKFISKQTLSNVNQLEILERIGSFKTNFIIISLLIVFTLLAILYNYFPKYFYAYFRYIDWFYWEIKDNVIQNTPFAFPNVLVVVILSFLSSVVGFYFITSNPNFFLVQGEEFRFYTSFEWVSTRTLLTFAIFFSRYLIYKIFTSLFKIEMITKVHFYKSIQTNLQFVALIYLSLVLITLYFGPSFTPNFEIISLLVYFYFFVRFVYFFQIFRKKYHLNVITLIAYLVIIEGQVLFFGLNQILFPSIN